MADNGISRRDTLRGIGIVFMAGAAPAVTGCLDGGGDGDGENGGDTIPGSDYPAVETWLTETDVGDSDDTYDGTIKDHRGQDTVMIQVGAEGNGDYFAFAPDAVAISPGTEVKWVWTGRGGQHNAEAIPDEQIGESDYEFASELTGEEGFEFTYTFDDPGLALYHCEPHLAMGMKGAIVIAESE